jgi:hypothetical protein
VTAGHPSATSVESRAPRHDEAMNVGPAAASAIAGMHGAQSDLDRAAHAIANVNTEDPRPLQEDRPLGAPEQIDLAAEIAMTITAPVRYAANAQVVRADDQARASLVDAVA